MIPSIKDDRVFGKKFNYPRGNKSYYRRSIASNLIEFLTSSPLYLDKTVLLVEIVCKFNINVKQIKDYLALLNNQDIEEDRRVIYLIDC